MKIFYVRPPREGAYGRGDGTSYENAWNGVARVDWDAVAAAEPATVWVCGNPDKRSAGFVTVQVERAYLEESDLESAETRPHPRRESAVAV
jgi:hypothetical protein